MQWVLILGVQATKKSIVHLCIIWGMLLLSFNELLKYWGVQKSLYRDVWAPLSWARLVVTLCVRRACVDWFWCDLFVKRLHKYSCSTSCHPKQNDILEIFIVASSSLGIFEDLDWPCRGSRLDVYICIHLHTKTNNLFSVWTLSSWRLWCPLD